MLSHAVWFHVQGVTNKLFLFMNVKYSVVQRIIILENYMRKKSYITDLEVRIPMFDFLQKKH
jgi:hypothetical protein